MVCRIWKTKKRSKTVRVYKSCFAKTQKEHAIFGNRTVLKSFGCLLTSPWWSWDHCGTAEALHERETTCPEEAAGRLCPWQCCWDDTNIKLGQDTHFTHYGVFSTKMFQWSKTLSQKVVLRLLQWGQVKLLRVTIPSVRWYRKEMKPNERRTLNVPARDTSYAKSQFSKMTMFKENLDLLLGDQP